MSDVGFGQMTEDQLAIWNRLNERRLTQEQDRVPAPKGITNQRIRERLPGVKDVVAPIQRMDISKINSPTLC